MNKKILFGFLVSALFLAGCGQKGDEISANIAHDPRGDLEDLIFERGFTSPEYFESVKSAVLDIQLQEAVKVAVEKKTPESCDRIPDEYLKKNCRDTMIEQKAIAENDEEMCQKISDRAAQIACSDDIYSRRATTDGDSLLCNKIEDEKMQADCVVGAALSRALIDLDPRACNPIEDQDAREFCIEEVKREVGLAHL